MFYVQIKDTYTTQTLVDMVADRMQSQMTVSIVSTTPEDIFDELQPLWTAATKQLITERDYQPDVAYMKALTDIITNMQRAKIAFSEDSLNQAFILAHPYELKANVWQGRQILVCCDEVSWEAVSQLMSNVESDFDLVIGFTKNKTFAEAMQKLGFKDLSKAHKKQRMLLRKQSELCRELGIDARTLLASKQVDSSSLGRSLKALNDHAKRSEFMDIVNELSALRVVCGRADSHRSLSKKNLDALKVLTAHVLPKEASSDWQLFDDPYSYSWKKRMAIASAQNRH